MTDSRDPENLEEPDIRLLLQAVAPAQLEPERREALWARVLTRIRAPPPPLTSTLRADEGEWVPYMPGTSRKILRVDEAEGTITFLIRLEPGVVVQTHAHRQVEECLVLEGEVMIGEHTFREGDWHVAHPGSVHQGFGTRTGCLLLIRTELEESAPAEQT